MDRTANTGRPYIGEEGQNVSEMSEAKVFEGYEQAALFAQDITTGCCEFYDEWASIVAI